MGKGVVHKIGSRYLRRSVDQISSGKKEVYHLSEDQKRGIRSIKIETYFWSALIGVVAVLIVVLPVNLFPTLFGIQHFSLFGTEIEFEVYYTIFAIAMLFPEIWALNYIHLRAVKKMCLVCKYPNNSIEDYDEQVSLLTEAGLEMPAKHLELFNIDPYIGLSKFSYYSIFILNKLKATLTNIVVKLLVKRLLGRYALRIVTDLAGIPIFAFWNAWASAGILKETQMRIMSTAATRDFLEEIPLDELKNIETKIGPLFHFIAQQKRSYNFALYAYMKEVFGQLPSANVENNREIEIDELFGDSIPENLLIARMLVFGLMVDGSISVKEKKSIKYLVANEWFPYTMEQLEDAVDGYSKGKGFPRL